VEGCEEAYDPGELSLVYSHPRCDPPELVKPINNQPGVYSTPC
jgi:hypothetical protein